MNFLIILETQETAFASFPDYRLKLHFFDEQNLKFDQGASWGAHKPGKKTFLLFHRSIIQQFLIQHLMWILNHRFLLAIDTSIDTSTKTIYANFQLSILHQLLRSQARSIAWCVLYAKILLDFCHNCSDLFHLMTCSETSFKDKRNFVVFDKISFKYCSVFIRTSQYHSDRYSI